MSLIVEIGGMLAGMLAEYATSKKWSKPKVFFVTTGILFTLFSSYVLLSPPEKGILFGILLAICLGMTLGLVFIVLIYYHEKWKK